LERGLIYPSFESRSAIAALVAERDSRGGWPRDPDGAPLYPGTSKNLSAAEREHRMASEPYSLRLDMNAAVAQAGSLQWKESGAGPQGETGRVVTHVVRGHDLFWATSVHRLLQALLGLAAPVYHHHRLLLDAEGRKLSKSTQATGLRELRAQGLTLSEIRRLIRLD